MKFDLPNLKPISPAEQWRIAVRQVDVVKSQVALESAVSFPVPNTGQAHFFLYRSMSNEDGFRIIGRVTLNLLTLAADDVRLATKDKPFPNLPESVPLTKATGNMEDRQAFYDLYDLVIERFPRQAAGVIGEQWLESLRAVVPRSLIPYYEALNPAFFEWCRGG